MPQKLVMALIVACAAWPLCLPAPAQSERAPMDASTIRLEDLDLSKMRQDWGAPRAGRSVEGNPLRIGGRTFEHGVGTHAGSDFYIDLRGAARRFEAFVGVDDESGAHGSVRFEVWVDGEAAARSGVLRGGQQAERIEVDLSGKKSLLLVVSDAGDGNANDHANWADAVLVLEPEAEQVPVATFAPEEPAPPIASGDPPRPEIHGPRVVGASPGNPFLFRIPATGQPPLVYAARGLPEGLALDEQTGLITGRIVKSGTYPVRLEVRGPKGKARRTLTIAAGERMLARTPPMGWNSWNVWGTAVDATRVREAADWMVKSGLAAHGYQYINIDDAWEGERDADGEIQTNDKFGDMKALADYVHARGLKLGIYSSPGPRTCAGFAGSHGHEQQDADTYAKWGIDYLKYDWCSYGEVRRQEGLPGLKEPYLVMRTALDRCGRDIVYSLCQYGMGDVWTWGAEVGGNLWRTTGDITDTWGSMASIGFGQAGKEPYAGPGHWNDPDMLVVGQVGWGPNVRPTRLTKNEQITHITLWSLLAAPLLIGCDLSQLDSFTVDLLTNPEVIDVNQDALGRQAGRRAADENHQVWSRPLWDGTTAVGLFNLRLEASEVTARWADLGLAGRQPVRDLWQRNDLGRHDGSFTARVPGHGAVLVKVGKPRKAD